MKNLETKLEGNTWKVWLIEKEFLKRMCEAEG